MTQQHEGEKQHQRASCCSRAAGESAVTSQQPGNTATGMQMHACNTTPSGERSLREVSVGLSLLSRRQRRDSRVQQGKAPPHPKETASLKCLPAGVRGLRAEGGQQRQARGVPACCSVCFASLPPETETGRPSPLFAAALRGGDSRRTPLAPRGCSSTRPSEPQGDTAEALLPRRRPAALRPDRLKEAGRREVREERNRDLLAGSRVLHACRAASSPTGEEILCAAEGERKSAASVAVAAAAAAAAAKLEEVDASVSQTEERGQPLALSYREEEGRQQEEKQCPLRAALCMQRAGDEKRQRWDSLPQLRGQLGAAAAANRARLHAASRLHAISSY
ncbi:hypothetical protein Efla_007477 [Eimeria flavescens]